MTDVIVIGVPTLDRVKRLTRAGMGRCQGGFCFRAPRIIAIQCEELGLEPEQPTKFGGGSHLLSSAGLFLARSSFSSVTRFCSLSAGSPKTNARSGAGVAAGVNRGCDREGCLWNRCGCCGHGENCLKR